MTNVPEARKGADGGSQWKVPGPLGATVPWDAETTRRVPGELLAWKTLPGAAIRHTGIVRLEGADGGIRVDVTLSSNPVAGPAGMRWLAVGVDPRQQLDGDLPRMKTLLETFKGPRCRQGQLSC